MNNKQIVKTIKDNLGINSVNDINKIIDDIVNNITLFLSVEIEFKSFDKYKRLFELDCRKAVNLMFNSLYEKESKLVIFPDIIPGFTTIIYKKNENFFNPKKLKEKKDINSVLSLNDNSALTHMLNSFFEENTQMVLTIESNEFIMMMCPVNDLEKYFKELDLYIN